MKYFQLHLISGKRSTRCGHYERLEKNSEVWVAEGVAGILDSYLVWIFFKEEKEHILSMEGGCTHPHPIYLAPTAPECLLFRCIV